MPKPFGVYYDVDGCMLMSRNPPGKSASRIYRSTFYCKYNDIDTRKVLSGLIGHGVVSAEAVEAFERRFGGIVFPSDIINLGEYARFDGEIKTAGHAIGKEQLKEMEDRATEGMSVEAFYHSLQDAVETPGLEEFSGWAKANGARSFIVTNGWRQVGEYLAERLGIDRIIGYEPVFENGRFTGEVRPTGPKEPIILQLMGELGVTYHNSVGIDDGDVVIQSFGLPVAFCPTNQKLRQIPGAVIIEEPSYVPVRTAAEKWLSEKL